MTNLMYNIILYYISIEYKGMVFTLQILRSITDAVASVGNIAVDVDELGVDLITLSGLSLGAPKGIASLYFRNNIRLLPLMLLNAEGIYANTGSACASKALKTSPVIVAIGVPADMAQGSVVFTMNRSNSKKEVDYILEKLDQSVEKLRSLSPLWRKKTAAL